MFHKASYNGREGVYFQNSGRVCFENKIFDSIADAIKFFGK